MSKLINLTYPYEIKNIKSLNEFLLVLKNILRISERRGLIEKKGGILIPVRWSKKYNQCVVDIGTDLFRDREGISLDNVNLYFYKKKHELIKKAITYTLNSINSELFLNKTKIYNMHKNENKFLSFEYCCNITDNNVNSEYLYLIGLFQRCETKKRSGIVNKDHRSILIDNSTSLYNVIKEISHNISSINKFTVISYIEVYNKFISLIQKKSFSLNVDNVSTKFEWKNILNTNPTVNNKSYKDAISLYKLDKSLSLKDFNKVKSEFFIYSLYVEFFLFLKDYFDVSDVKGFIVTDLNNNIYYKLFYANNKNIDVSDVSKIEIQPPLLFKVF